MVAELVAGGIVLEVGGVGDVGLAFFLQVVLYVLSAHVEQGAEDVSVDGTDARHTPYASSAHQVHEHSLYIVIAVMCHHDGFGTDVPAQLLEVAVAQFAGGKLDAHLMQGCIFPGVEMHTMERHAEPLAERDNKSLVAVGLVATQMKVAVNRLHRTSLLNHLEQQANTVCPPAQSHKIFLHSSF